MSIIYPFYHLSNAEFESLVNDVCHKILGTGAIRFSKGADGGRDGRFEGTAEKFPSSRSPWSGLFIVQAKHTIKPNGSCSDYDFEKKEVPKEIERLKKLTQKESIQNYIIFTNRKLAGNQEAKLRKKIVDETEIRNVSIIGIEDLSGKISLEKEVLEKYQLLLLKEPLRFFDKDLKSVILAFKSNLKELKTSEEIFKILKNLKILKNIDKEKKNELNSLSKEYFQHIQESSLSYFKDIENFLSDPNNTDIRDQYDATVLELQSKILEKRNHFMAFEEIINYLYNILIDKHEELKEAKPRKLVYVFLHYMYFHCDIGVKE